MGRESRRGDKENTEENKQQIAVSNIRGNKKESSLGGAMSSSGSVFFKHNQGIRVLFSRTKGKR
jgi:hypothetical protein